MILVHVDHDRGAVDAVSLQALTLARSLDSDVQAVIMGGSEFAPELGEYGASTVHVAEHPGLTDYAPQATARAITGLIASLSPAAVLGAGTARGNEVLAHVAAMTDLPFAADCTEITLGSPVGVTRARWGGNLLEESTVITTTLLATVFAHAIPAVPSPAAGAVSAFTPELSPADLAVVIIERAGAASAGEDRVRRRNVPADLGFAAALPMPRMVPRCEAGFLGHSQPAVAARGRRLVCAQRVH